MKRCYLSGPMTGIPEFNYPAFQAAAEALRARGHSVLSPHEHEGSGLDVETSTWEDFIRRDLRMLTECDTIVLLDGWHRSRGARLEHHVALALSMDVLTISEALPPTATDRLVAVLADKAMNDA